MCGYKTIPWARVLCHDNTKCHKVNTEEEWCPRAEDSDRLSNRPHFGFGGWREPFRLLTSAVVPDRSGSDDAECVGRNVVGAAERLQQLRARPVLSRSS